MVFTKLALGTLRSRIAAQIREAILNGTLPGGQRLVERTIAAELGTSITSVREAMIELESEGFLTKTPNSATHVTELTLSEIEKIFAVRRVLEAYAVEEACRFATPPQACRLEQVYSDMVECALKGDGKGMVSRDAEFHALIWQFTQNEYLQVALKRVVMPYFAFAAIRISSGVMDPEGDAYSHEPLVTAIKNNDVAGARAAFEKSIRAWTTAESDKFSTLAQHASLT